MEDDDAISVWDPHPWNTVSLGVIGVVVWTGVVLLSSDARTWWTVVALLVGYLIILTVCMFVTVPIRYTLTRTDLTSRRRGTIESLPVVEITRIAGGYMPKVGSQIYISGPSGGIATLNIGPDETTRFLRRLGELVEESGRDQAVIADEKTRRALGLPGGGLRDPWTPPVPDTPH